MSDTVLQPLELSAECSRFNHHKENALRSFSRVGKINKAGFVLARLLLITIFNFRYTRHEICIFLKVGWANIKKNTVLLKIGLREVFNNFMSMSNLALPQLLKESLIILLFKVI